MNRTVTVFTDKIIEIPGLGLIGPEEPNGEVFKYTENVTDEQVALWEAVNGREWPKDGITVGAVKEPNPQGELFESVVQNTSSEDEK